MDSRQVGKDNYCFICGGKGFPDRKCESCGREPKKLSFNFEERDSSSFVEKIDAFGIPGKYRGVLWNAEILKKSFREKAEDRAFQKFVSQLDKVDNVFTKGILSDKSAVIIAPAGYSKMVFAYSCMQRALDAGFSVAPFLDTSELKRLLVLSSENPHYKLYGKVSYDEYVLCDVCFVTVSKLPVHEWAYNTIQELFDRRARKGLGTFVTSRYGLDEISRRDASNQFGVISTAISDDSYKYPAVINYRPL
ncbi:MAG: hypothetical protein K1W15_03060 [Lachnospiraceae bacterium]